MDHRLLGDDSKYKSSSQKARVLTEEWVRKSSYCPNCGNASIEKHPNNKQVADFFCESCGEQFELKSKDGSFGSVIVDGEYHAMMRALRSTVNPNFLLLNYRLTLREVTNYVVVPKHFFVPDIIIKRKPLSETAERARWTGCNIDMRLVPQAGRVFVIKQGKDVPKKKVLEDWQRTLFLRHTPANEKGWTLDVMRCVDSMKKPFFTLDEIYAYEPMLKEMHPSNNHIKEKIRQQLQVLRDGGYIVFEARGKYRVRNR